MVQAFDIFNNLKLVHKVETLHVNANEMFLHNGTFKNSKEYIEFAFKRKGIVIDRYRHEYDSFAGDNPKIGLIFMAGDSTLDPTFEVHALIGHNATYTDRVRSEAGLE